MSGQEHDLLLTAEWAAGYLVPSPLRSTAEETDAVSWILENPLHVRELLLAASLDIALRVGSG